MGKFFARAKLFDEDQEKIEDVGHTVTKSARESFQRIVWKKVRKHRRADNLRELNPPVMLVLDFSMSIGQPSDQSRRVDVEEMTEAELKNEVQWHVDEYFEHLDTLTFGL